MKSSIQARQVIQEKVVINNSSLVDFLIYDHHTNELIVKYKRGKHKGKARVYNGVTPSDFQEIINATSVGKTLLRTLAKYKKEEGIFFRFFKNLFSNNSDAAY